MAGTFGGQNVGGYQGSEMNALLMALASDLDAGGRGDTMQAILAAFTTHDAQRAISTLSRPDLFEP